MFLIISKAYQALIKADYHLNNINVSQTGRKVTFDRLKFIHGLFGYQSLPKEYFSVTYAGWNANHAFLFLEADGVLLIFTDWAANQGGRENNSFTGDYRLIPYSAIQMKNIKDTYRHFSCKITINYDIENSHNTITFLAHNFALLPQLIHKVAEMKNKENENAYKIRITIYKQNVKRLGIKRTINDYSHSNENLLNTFKSLFDWKLNKIASRKEFNICVLLSVIISLIALFLPVTQMFKYLIYAMAYIFVILTGIKRVHDIQENIKLEFLFLIPVLNILFIIYLMFKQYVKFNQQEIIDLLKGIKLIK